MGKQEVCVFFELTLIGTCSTGSRKPGNVGLHNRKFQKTVITARFLHITGFLFDSPEESGRLLQIQMVNPRLGVHLVAFHRVKEYARNMEDMGNPALEDIITQRPLTARAMLDLYEGLAVSCEEIKNKMSGGSDALLQRRRLLYKEHVGVDPFNRETLREQVARILAAAG